MREWGRGGVTALATAVVLLVAVAAPPARAQGAGESAAPAPRAGEKSEPAPFATRSGSFALLATTFVGDGLRFNNPFRLATPLGSDAESVSRASSYVDLGATVLFGDPYGLRHGVALRWSIALEGVHQTAVTPSYEMWKRWRAWAAYGRLGPSIVTGPDTTWGMEASGGGVWFVRGGIGIAAEVVGDLFYGAGTRDVGTPAYPMLSGQLGLVVDWEVLP